MLRYTITSRSSHRRKASLKTDFPIEGVNAMSKLVRILSVASLFALAACHTVEGVGKDVQEVGEEVEEAAEDTRT